MSHIGQGATYIRFYPNPGFSIRISKKKRLVWSWHKGFEVKKWG